jgi:hypothetical protein
LFRTKCLFLMLGQTPGGSYRHRNKAKPSHRYVYTYIYIYIYIYRWEGIYIYIYPWTLKVLKYSPHVRPTSVLYSFICGDTQKTPASSDFNGKWRDTSPTHFSCLSSHLQKPWDLPKGREAPWPDVSMRASIQADNILNLLWSVTWQTALRTERFLMGSVYCACVISVVSDILHYVFIVKCNILLKFKTHVLSDICLDGMFRCEELPLEICPSTSDTPCIRMKMLIRTKIFHVCKAVTVSLLFKRKHPTYGLQIHIYSFQRTAERDKFYL